MAEPSDGSGGAHADANDDTEEHSDVSPGSYATPRTTAPQSSYTSRDIGIGLAVLAIGLVVTVGVPLVFVL